MKKYILIRVIFIIINLTVILTVFYFAMEYATNEKYYQFPFSQYYNNTITNFKFYITNILTLGDWGDNLSGEPVWDVLKPRIGVSMRINLLALAVYLPFGVLLGFISAMLKDTIVDNVISSVTIILGSIPTYVMMFLLVMFVGYYTDIVHYQYVQGKAPESITIIFLHSHYVYLP